MEYHLLLIRNGIEETRAEPFSIEGMSRGLTKDGSGQVDKFMVNKKWVDACRLIMKEQQLKQAR